MNRDLKIALLNCTSAWSQFILLYLLQHNSRQRWDPQTESLIALDKELQNTIINFMKITREDFKYLLSLLTFRLRRPEAYIRDAITPKQKLIITLRFLAAGDTYKTLENAYGVPQQSIALFVPEVCSFLVTFLRKYVKLPSTATEWRKVSKEFSNKSGFPHAIGAIGGKHIPIKPPANVATEYSNYAHFYSIVLLAVVDANSNFMYVSVGCKGRTSSINIFRKSRLRHLLESSESNIPEATNVRDGSSQPIPYMLLADKSFAFSHHCMRPYDGPTEVGSVEHAFNERHAKAREALETAFGILSNRFRVLRKTDALSPRVATKVVLAAVYLHNFIRRNKNDRRGEATITCPLIDLREVPEIASEELRNVRLWLTNFFFFVDAIKCE